MMEKIDLVKEKLNTLIEKEDLKSEEVLNISEELDLLILEYYEEKNKEM